MDQLPSPYPAPQRMPADRRVALRSTLVSAIAEPDSTPRWARRRFLAVPASVGLATLLAVLQLLQPWATPAAWAAVPQQADAARTASLGASCAATIASHHFPMTVAPATAVLAETRGTSTAVLLVGGSQMQICVTGSVGDFVGVYEVAPFAAGSPGTVDAVPGSRDGGEALRVVFGRLASGSDTALVTTADGLNVTASVAASVAESGQQGYFLAWWPSHADASSVVVTAPSGARQALEIPDETIPLPTSR
jgi:hypothetical protein